MFLLEILWHFQICKYFFSTISRKSCSKSGKMKKNDLKMTVNRKIHVRISKKKNFGTYLDYVQIDGVKKFWTKKIHILASLIAINSLTLWCDNYAEQRQKNIPTLFFGTDGHEEPFPIKVQLGLEWSLKYSEMSTFCFWSGYEVDFGNLMVEKNHWHIPDQRKILRKKCEKNIWKH